ncbi:MAG TPA: type IV toxin-antitoxin system AbiEi family antitoxin domain-containing protein [Jiangellaceae bacterium]|nr:type IV toxin-antitoxin system AbiEi family antitoxin domain-containing protein [Jiangellaceae bacterium]
MRTRIPPEVLGLLTGGRGVFTAQDAELAQVSLDRVQRWARAGLLERVGKGAYAATDKLASASPWVAHAIRTRGFVMSRTTHTLAGGWSAVAVRGLPSIGPPPALPTAVHPSRTGSGAQRTRYGIVYPRELPPEHHGSHAGGPVVGAAWMVVDLARRADRAAALVVADAVVHHGTAMPRLRHVLAQLSGWPGARAATWVVAHVDGRSESALESLGRLACIEGRLPVPLSNVWVGPGYPLYRVDHLWPWHWVVAEGDGALKYRGRDPAQVIAAEKERQWQLRRLGLEVIRYGWTLAAHQRAELAARFRVVLADNPVRSTPIPWWPTNSPFIGQDGQVVA